MALWGVAPTKHALWVGAGGRFYSVVLAGGACTHASQDEQGAGRPAASRGHLWFHLPHSACIFGPVAVREVALRDGRAQSIAVNHSATGVRVPASQGSTMEGRARRAHMP